ncbi:hypothetical protein SLS60_008733 [Paraconiothyrium brasiliense]|uniref:Uncharacterized protein n=1 Tax=Paraconiothyrium brasiliense TaxID=300254 RepID=A0ABR3QYB3_9PLEO
MAFTAEPTDWHNKGSKISKYWKGGALPFRLSYPYPVLWDNGMTTWVLNITLRGGKLHHIRICDQEEEAFAQIEVCGIAIKEDKDSAL